MKNKTQIMIIFVLGIAVGIIAWNIVALAIPNPVYADATSGSSGGLIAVTGLCSNNYSGLWVLDTKESAMSPSLCLYVPESGGNKIKLAGARRIKYDLQLLGYNDSTDRKYSPSALKAAIDEMNAKEEKTQKPK